MFTGFQKGFRRIQEIQSGATGVVEVLREILGRLRSVVEDFKEFHDASTEFRYLRISRRFQEVSGAF